MQTRLPMPVQRTSLTAALGLNRVLATSQPLFHALQYIDIVDGRGPSPPTGYQVTGETLLQAQLAPLVEATRNAAL